MLYIFVFNSLQCVAKHYDQAFRNSTSNCVPIYYVNYGSKATSSLFTKKKKSHEIILPKRYPYFNKMTSCKKPVIFQAVSANLMWLAAKLLPGALRCWQNLMCMDITIFQAVSSFLFSHMMLSFNAFNLVFLFTGSTRSPLWVFVWQSWCWGVCLSCLSLSFSKSAECLFYGTVFLLWLRGYFVQTYWI